MKFLRTLPLALTIVRLLLGPVFMVAHRYDSAVEWLLLIVVAALATDWLDGFAARRWNAVSAAGKLMDPFADALFCMMVFVDFAQHGWMPLWIVMVLIVREFLVTFVLRPLAYHRSIVVAAGWPGKVKTALQFTTIIIVLTALEPRILEILPLQLLIWPLFISVLILSVWSGAGYLVAAAKAFTTKKPADAPSAGDAAGRSCAGGTSESGK